ncbi:MAG: protein kinase [Planctomycetes bacterium]|nr:protein kinase [Planctomycetota bacterium]
MQFAHFEFDPVADRLGEGPLSEVYRAKDQRLERTVALKILRPHAELDPAADQRFLREAKHTSNLQHKNIAVVYEYDVFKPPGIEKGAGTPYIAMEYLEGRTLDKILKDRRLGWEECTRIAQQVTDALRAVHENHLIHRDLKPGNIMVLDDGSVKLLDFGIARAANESSITQHGTLVGTVLYMSPEQVRGEELDLRSDIFSLGAVLYHTMTGELPFPGKSFPEVCMAILDCKPRRPSVVRPGFPAVFEAMILKCLSPEPADRYQDAAEAYGALLSIADRRGARTRTQNQIEGVMLLPPVHCADDDTACSQVAAGLRRDLATELGRTKGLEVRLVEGEQLPRDGAFDYVVRSTFKLTPPSGTLDLEIERWTRNGGAPTLRDAHVERIQQTEPDEWALQADLVRAATRTIRRRLSELAVRPSEGTVRNVERARGLTQRAHDVLLKGTSKHLMLAISSMRAAIDADPYCALAYAGLAEALVRKYLYWDGDEAFLAEAREYAERALALDPDCAEAHTSLGFAYHLSGHYTEAQREYRISIQHDSEEWLAHRLLGAILAREGNNKGAAGLLRRAITLKPSHIGSYDHLFKVLRRLDRYEEALEVASEGISAARARLKQEPDDQEARLHMALLLVRMGEGRFSEARRQVHVALEHAPKDGYTSFHSACVFAITGDLDEAMDQLTRARDRGYFIQSELRNNGDLDVLRQLPDFRELMH